MIIERIEEVKKARKPRDVTIAELKAEIRDLKRAVNEERAYATHMLDRMRQMSEAAVRQMSEGECRRCCTPTRAEALRLVGPTTIALKWLEPPADS
jgi:hypothetical protein